MNEASGGCWHTSCSGAKVAATPPDEKCATSCKKKNLFLNYHGGVCPTFHTRIVINNVKIFAGNVMECATILLTFLAAGAVLKETISQGTETYRILPFEASTGLYYEYQRVMRRKVSSWRVTSFLDTQKLCLGWRRINLG